MGVLAKWTVEDYHRMIEAGILSDARKGMACGHRRVELLEGEIVQMSPESPLHSGTSSKIVRYLTVLLEGRAFVRAATSIALPDSEPEPDVAIVRIKENNYCDRF